MYSKLTKRGVGTTKLLREALLQILRYCSEDRCAISNILYLASDMITDVHLFEVLSLLIRVEGNPSTDEDLSANIRGHLSHARVMLQQHTPPSSTPCSPPVEHTSAAPSSCKKRSADDPLEFPSPAKKKQPTALKNTASMDDIVALGMDVIEATDDDHEALQTEEEEGEEEALPIDDNDDYFPGDSSYNDEPLLNDEDFSDAITDFVEEAATSAPRAFVSADAKVRLSPL